MVPTLADPTRAHRMKGQGIHFDARGAQFWGVALGSAEGWNDPHDVDELIVTCVVPQVLFSWRYSVQGCRSKVDSITNGTADQPPTPASSLR